jgi:hypothetical protein
MSLLIIVSHGHQRQNLIDLNKTKCLKEKLAFEKHDETTRIYGNHSRCRSEWQDLAILNQPQTVWSIPGWVWIQ